MIKTGDGIVETIKKRVWQKHRVVTLISACVVLAATIGGVLLFSSKNNVGAADYPATLHYTRSHILGYNQFGDNRWGSWIDLNYNGTNYQAYATVQCTSPGVAYRRMGDYNIMVSSNMVPNADGTVNFTGSVTGGYGQSLGISFSVELNNPYQPVVRSNVSQPQHIIGQGGLFQDDLKVYEANSSGDQVTAGSAWLYQNGAYAPTNVALSAYGPFASKQAKVPNINSGGKYFGGSSGATENPKTIDTSQITIIGDSITYNSISQIRSAFGALDPDDGDGSDINILTNGNNPRGFYSTPTGGDNGYTVLSNLASSDVRDYVVYALGSYDPSASYDVTQVINKIKEKNPNAQIVFVSAYNGTYPLTGADGCWDYWDSSTGVAQPTDPPNINCTIAHFNNSFRMMDGSLPADTVVMGWWNIVNQVQIGNPDENIDPVYLVENNNGGINPTNDGKTAFAQALADTVSGLFPDNSSTTFPTDNSGQWGIGDVNPAGSNVARGTVNQIFSGASVPGQNGWPSGGWQSMTFAGSDQWPAGHYYFVANVNATRDNNSYYLNDNWYSPFGEDTEYIINRFQPYATSDVETTYVGDGDDVVDTITARVTDDVSKANSDWDNSAFDIYWPASAGLDVNICVDLYGPSQAPLSNSASTSVSSVVSSSKLSTMCHNFNHASQEIDFNFSEFARNNDNWGGFSGVTHSGFTNGQLNSPGYYYFQAYIKDATGGVDGQTAGIADLILDEWKAWFNPEGETEWLYRKFIPVTKSLAQGNRDRDGYDADKGTNDRGSNAGVVFDCDETDDIYNHGAGGNVLNDLLQNNNNMLTCRGLADYVYIGATDSRDINGTVVADNHASDTSWPKDSNGNYEQIRYRAKLYGPFADPEAKSPGTGVGATVQTVPYSGAQWKAPYASQPVAMSEFQIASNGPKYNFMSGEYYSVTFKQDASGGTSGLLTTTNLKLAPGFYVSVIEILTSDQCDMASGACGTGEFAPVGASMMENNFYSAWGDPYESVSIAQPVYSWSLRGNSNRKNYGVGDVITDTIWTVGFSNKYNTEIEPGSWQEHTRTDALGIDMHTHSTSTWNGYTGTSGYFGADSKADVNITLYRFNSQPTTVTCPAGGETVWSSTMKSQDYNHYTQQEPFTTSSHTITKPGWYVYVTSFAGDDRTYPFTSACNDVDEMFNVLGEFPTTPKLTTQIQTEKPTAPTVVSDEVGVDGSPIEANSIVDLALYRQIGNSIDMAVDNELCSIRFTISAAGSYSTKNYINTDGTVKSGSGHGKCFAEMGGHYYWRENFLRADGTTPYNNYPLPSNEVSDGEEVDLALADPEVITVADPTVMVGEPFKDTAHITLPIEGREYQLYFTAHGPGPADGSAAVCTTENILFSNKSNSITVTKSGEYTSPTTTANSPGNVYWIETLVDVETGQEYSGYCGKEGEITRINGPELPKPPAAGLIVRSVITISALGAVTTFLVWQWVSPSSLLFRRR